MRSEKKMDHLIPQKPNTPLVPLLIGDYMFFFALQFISDIALAPSFASDNRFVS